jgi:hypothetical protein
MTQSYEYSKLFKRHLQHLCVLILLIFAFNEDWYMVL